MIEMKEPTMQELRYNLENSYADILEEEIPGFDINKVSDSDLKNAHDSAMANIIDIWDDTLFQEYFNTFVDKLKKSYNKNTRTSKLRLRR